MLDFVSGGQEGISSLYGLCCVLGQLCLDRGGQNHMIHSLLVVTWQPRP